VAAAAVVRMIKMEEMVRMAAVVVEILTMTSPAVAAEGQVELDRIRMVVMVVMEGWADVSLNLILT
jgi:hypothetical protein